MREIIFFFKNHAESEAGRLVPDLFLFLRKERASGLKLDFNIYLAYNKNKLDPEICSIFIFQKRDFE